MSTYTGSTIGNLNPTTPTIGTGQVKELDDAIRQIKRFLRESGPGTLVDLMYPIGRPDYSFTSNDPASEIQGRHSLSAPFGTWVKLAGVTLVAHKDEDPDFGTVFAPALSNEDPDGGEKTHSLTEAENGPHSHTSAVVGQIQTDQGGGLRDRAVTGSTGVSGEGAPHNNLQPYRTVYAWVRVA